MKTIRRIFLHLASIGIQNDMQARQRVTLMLYNQLLLIGLVACISFLVFNYLNGYTDLALIDTMSISVIIICLAINYIKLYELAQTVGFICLPLYLFFFRIFFGVPNVEVYFLAFIILAMYSLTRWAEFLTVLTYFGMLTAVSQLIVPQFEFEEKYSNIWDIQSATSIGISSLLILLTVRVYYKAGIKPFFVKQETEACAK